MTTSAEVHMLVPWPPLCRGYAQGDSGSGQLGQGDNHDRWNPSQVQRLHTSPKRYYDLRMSYIKPWKALQVWNSAMMMFVEQPAKAVFLCQSEWECSGVVEPAVLISLLVLVIASGGILFECREQGTRLGQGRGWKFLCQNMLFNIHAAIQWPFSRLHHFFPGILWAQPHSCGRPNGTWCQGFELKVKVMNLISWWVIKLQRGERSEMHSFVLAWGLAFCLLYLYVITSISRCAESYTLQWP